MEKNKSKSKSTSMNVHTEKFVLLNGETVPEFFKRKAEERYQTKAAAAAAKAAEEAAAAAAAAAKAAEEAAEEAAAEALLKLGELPHNHGGSLPHSVSFIKNNKKHTRRVYTLKNTKYIKFENKDIPISKLKLTN